MAFRFQRTLRIAPGIRINLSKGGASLSLGPRGASVTIGRRGTHANVGLPGTGLSYRRRIDTPAERGRAERHRGRERREHARAAARRRTDALAEVSLALGDRGELLATDAQGKPLSGDHRRLLWAQQGEAIGAWLNERMDAINGDVELLANIHLDTPAPTGEPEHLRVAFAEPEPEPPPTPPMAPAPEPPARPEPGLLTRLFGLGRSAHAQRVAAADAEHRRRHQAWLAQKRARAEEHRRAVARWKRAHADWRRRKVAHDAAEAEHARRFPERLRTDPELMETLLAAALDDLDWPRETLVSFDIQPHAATVWLDVDLPEIADLPQREARLAKRRRRLLIQPKPKTRLRQEYAAHVHGVVLRCAGTVFATLPGIGRVVVSGYSQRPDAATGAINDDYLLSVDFDRDGFGRIDFTALERVDPVAAVAAFPHRRRLLKRDGFRAIEPFAMVGAIAAR
ncbi:DUF4236 domain-containing protein [uncultured Thiohalocapsa sp.]|uniref:DUF4236 domain-containing protein n=1 Tax=uncultured Thiohalocapsa sp. TaxID=768990 RepID=UPI0025D08491|nr:DUF4236 domain-containing protein [uncultured Thiohalocapsa sp.]